MPQEAQSGLVLGSFPSWRFSTTRTIKRTCNNTGTHATKRVRSIQPLLQCRGPISAASPSPQKTWHHPSGRFRLCNTSQHLAQRQSARDFFPIRLHWYNYSGRALRATVNGTQLRAWPVQAAHSAIQVFPRGRQHRLARPFMLTHPLARQGDPRGKPWCTSRCLLALATLILGRHCAVDLFTGRHWHQCHPGTKLSSGRALTETRHTN